MNSVIDLLKDHRSIRQFTPEPISEEQLVAIIEAANWSATSNFVQAYSIIRVTHQETRQQIARLAGDQTWVEKSPLVLMFCADLNRSKNACAYENKEMAKGFTEQLILATVDVGIAAQNAMIAAESMGLGGVFIGGIRNDPEKVCDLLKIPDQVYPVFGMCLGYPDGESQQKPRLPVSVILKEEVYQEDIADLKHYNETCRDYYQNRSKGSRNDTWTRQVSNLMSRPSRPHMKSFLAKKGFGVR